ncbi:MAG: porin family protein [archaeon]|nr:porin family protein [archaeon]
MYNKLFLTVFFILLFSSLGFAQGFDDLKGVQVNDGTLIYGDIIEKNSRQVIIEKKDGSRVSVKWDDVVHFLRNEPTKKTINSEHSRSPDNKKPYLFTLKGGIFEPTGDLEDFDIGFLGEIAFTQYFAPNFAIEYTIGYLQTDNEEAEINQGLTSGSLDITAIPVTMNVKGIIPFAMGEIYVGMGIGIYVVQMGDVSGSESFSTDDNDVLIGGQLLAGFGVDINDTTFWGIEGKCIVTDKASMSHAQIGSVEFDLGGYSIMAVLGFRF